MFSSLLFGVSLKYLCFAEDWGMFWEFSQLAEGAGPITYMNCECPAKKGNIQAEIAWVAVA